ncbi:MAG: ATP-binding protein [Erysipelotrichia bacterium]|nr:ATP-binding protein [Erysipelotrichia bacterium]
MTHLTIEASVKSIDSVTDFVNEQLDSLGCSMKIQMQIDIAVDEIFSNIANYAYPEINGNAEIIVDSVNNPRGVRITFRDQGMKFNPLTLPDPDVTASAENRSAGGLGIFIVRNSMDRTEYKYEDGFNVFSITKNLD